MNGYRATRFRQPCYDHENDGLNCHIDGLAYTPSYMIIVEFGIKTKSWPLLYCPLLSPEDLLERCCQPTACSAGAWLRSIHSTLQIKNQQMKHLPTKYIFELMHDFRFWSTELPYFSIFNMAVIIPSAAAAASVQSIPVAASEVAAVASAVKQWGQEHVVLRINTRWQFPRICPGEVPSPSSKKYCPPHQTFSPTQQTEASAAVDDFLLRKLGCIKVKLSKFH